MAKGGGSANKSYLFQEDQGGVESGETFDVPRLFVAGAGHRGMPAVPPRWSSSGNQRGVGAEDRQVRLSPVLRRPADPRWPGRQRLPRRGDGTGHPPADPGVRHRRPVRRKYFCHDVRVIRLPRHGASAPIAIACELFGRPAGAGEDHARGRFLGELEHDPATSCRGHRRPPRRRRGGDRPQPADDRGAQRPHPVAGQDAREPHRDRLSSPAISPTHGSATCWSPANPCRST